MLLGDEALVKTLEELPLRREESILGLTLDYIYNTFPFSFYF